MSLCSSIVYYSQGSGLYSQETGLLVAYMHHSIFSYCLPVTFLSLLWYLKKQEFNFNVEFIDFLCLLLFVSIWRKIFLPHSPESIVIISYF